MTKNKMVLGLALAAGLSGCADVGPEGEPIATETAPLLGGTYTSLRPEIGYLAAFGKGCTATVVNARYVVTAAHCFDYATGPVTGGKFTTFSTAGAQYDAVVDYAYSLGTAVGSTDIAFAHLATALPAAAGVTPATFGARPATGAAVSVFGYGCQNRDTQAGPPTKQYADYAYPDSFVSCQGDSGGPRVHGLHGAAGAIWGITSGYSGVDGKDINADAVAWGPMMLRAVTALGGSRGKTNAVTSFDDWAKNPGDHVRALAGDFDGDGLGDVALVGGPGWSSIPVAYANAGGGFTVSNLNIASFGAWATVAQSAVAADFNGDGKTDIALVGGPSWSVIPMAMSHGRNVAFSLETWHSDALLAQTLVAGTYVVAGDFDADGFGDLAVLGTSNATGIPVFRSNGTTFAGLPVSTVPSFPAWSRVSGARASVEDFNGDGLADIALTGGTGWTTIPVAYSDGEGGFTVTSKSVGTFPGWTRQVGTKVIAGDFNADGKADLAVLGGAGWRTVGFAFGNGTGGFSVADLPMANVPKAAEVARFVVPAELDTNGRTDVIVLGSPNPNELVTALLKP